MSEPLYWHCLDCGDHDPVEPTGDGNAYALGDRAPCITCSVGTAHVVTVAMGARFEQGIAMGLGRDAALKRAQEARAK